MTALFDANNAEKVLRSGLPKALIIANRALEEVERGNVYARELMISKRLSRDLTAYRSLPVHVVAALLGAEDEGNSRYVLVNSKNSNPYLRVKPVVMIEKSDKRYDRRKYMELTKRAVMSLLSPFTRELQSVTPLVVHKLDEYSK